MAEVSAPIQVYYGSHDFLIAPETNSLRLKELYPKKINLTMINAAGHNQIYISKKYYDELKKLFSRF